jgi:D-psicose/D-tagatose/L-ribulose 3-epimerase
MKLAISNIGWTNEEEEDVANLLQKMEVKYVEIAPTKLWQDPTNATPKAINDYLKFWEKRGIKIVAFQSMLFARPDLKLFESEENRNQTLLYLQEFIRLAGRMKTTRMVFGSPKNRQKATLDDKAAMLIAKDFFNKLGDVAKENEVCFCIEPNPTDYDCDFITSARQGIDLVKSVGNDGFGLHLDIAGMTLARDDVQSSIYSAKSNLKHFHISSPYLEQVEDRADVHHREAAQALKKIDYSGYVSIEMRPGEVGENVRRVEKAVRFAQRVYE